MKCHEKDTVILIFFNGATGSMIIRGGNSEGWGGLDIVGPRSSPDRDFAGPITCFPLRGGTTLKCDSSDQVSNVTIPVDVSDIGNVTTSLLPNSVLNLF